MNIVNKLTIRHLKENKRRTLVTIIGVIISVAMVSAVVTLGVSFLDLMKREAIAAGGEWHVLYQDVNKKQLEAIHNDKETEQAAVSKDIGYGILEGTQNDNKPYVFIRGYDTEGFNRFPIKLSEGRLPQAANEAVISEEIASNAKVKFEIGDTITFDAGDRIAKNGKKLSQNDFLVWENDELSEGLQNTKKVSYKVTGIIERPSWEPTWAPGYTILPYVDESAMGEAETFNAFVTVKKVKGSIFAHAEELAGKNGINVDSIAFNGELLRYYGVTDNDNLHTTLYSLLAIIMGVIMIGAVSLIYNAFAISVSERSRHLGMLSSVGATKRQKRNSVFFEGVLIGVISIPIGIICGLAGIGITFFFINAFLHDALGVTEKLTVMVTPLSIIIACGISMLTIFISTYLPAVKASKITAIDAIRQTTDVKLTGKAVKTSRIVRRFFGIEGEIGLKNLKRNKRRYRATIFSLVISIVLFLAVSYFTSSLKKSLELSQAGVSYDIQIGMDAENEKHVTETITKLKEVTEFSKLKNLNADSLVGQEAIPKELKERTEKDGTLLENGKYPYFIQIHALDEESLKSYAKKTGTDFERLMDTENISAIVIDTITYEDIYAGKFVETKAIHAENGQSLDLLYTENWETGERAPLGKVEIAALTDQTPMGISSISLGGLDIIVSEKALNELAKNKVEDEINSELYLKTDDPMKTQREIEELEENNLYVYNVFQSRQRDEQMILLMSVFTYGFIALITAISIANIFNTISTSISLRKREFAMLKSVGMTPKGFNKMIHYESLFYGINSLLYGLPISVIVMYLIYRATMNTFSYEFALPWGSILSCLAAVFVIVSAAMLYSSSKVKKENIIDGLKQESI